MTKISRALKRIFSLPINRSTYREIHSALFNILDNSADNSNAFLEVLLTGNVTSDKAKLFPKKELASLIEEFSIPAWTAKDVFERGDFISLVTSDRVASPTQHVFSNRIKRMDGQEFHFVSDVESTLHILRHFASRVQELDSHAETKKDLNGHKKEIQSIKEMLEKVLSTIKN